MGIRTKFNPLGGRKGSSAKVADVVIYTDPVTESSTTWVLMDDGDLYGCGYNGYYQQGNGSTSNVTSFTKRASNVVQVACSNDTTWYIDSNGDLYGCGRGDKGQQGNGSTSNVTSFTKRASNVVKVICSNLTAWYIDNGGSLYGCGSGNYGQQGNNATSNVTSFTNRGFAANAGCSDGTSFYIAGAGGLANGLVYGCGLNGGYQQGNDSTTNVKKFTAKYDTNYDDVIGTDIFCNYYNTSVLNKNTNTLYSTSYIGATTYHSFTAIQNVASVGNGVSNYWYINTSGDLYGMGDGSHGQQGGGSTATVNSFTYKDGNVNQITCSGETTWYIKNNGDLYGCGLGNYGQQGSGDTNNSIWAFKRASNVAKVVCANNVTWYIDNNGDLYGCGYGGNGQQGNGSTSDVLTFENKMQYLQ